MDFLKNGSSFQTKKMRGLHQDKVAVITGASRGIGAMTALVFTIAGARVVLAARNEEELKKVATNIEKLEGEALVVPTDVSAPRSIEKLIQLTVDQYGKLDIAFNNAAGGGHRPTPLDRVSVEDFDSAYQVNLRGTFLSMKYEIPAMLANGGGSIVNMSSTAGIRGVQGLSAYSASKHGVVGLTKTAALDYANQNLRVNAITPGPILTHRLAFLDDDIQKRIAQTVPMQHIGRPEEVAFTVAWLCSDAASFITGAVIPVDGGQLANLNN